MPRLFFAAFAALSFFSTTVQAQNNPTPAQLAPAVTVVKAQEREVIERAIVVGTLVPREEVLVAPEIEGLRITDVLVEEGQQVAQGQVLARLSSDLLEAALAQNSAAIARAEAAYAQAQSQIVQAEAAQVEAQKALERARTLLRGGNTTEALLEQRESTARASDARLAAARDGLGIAVAEQQSAAAMRQETQARLTRTEIKASRAGIISRKSARIGATATAVGEPLFRIIADGEIELAGEVTEAQIGRIKEGASAQIRIDQSKAIEGRVRIIFPEIDRTTRLGQVRVSLPKSSELRIGSFARGTVEIARHTGVAVPSASVIYDTEGATVQVVVGDKVQSRRVHPGLSAEGFIEILEGVTQDEKVVAKAGSFLRDGDIVRPVLDQHTTTAEGVQ